MQKKTVPISQFGKLIRKQKCQVVNPVKDAKNSAN